MKKINIILSGGAVIMNSYSYYNLKFDGQPDSDAKPTIFGVSKNLNSVETTQGVGAVIFGFNPLYDNSYVKQTTQYRIVSSIGSNQEDLLQLSPFNVIKKNGVSSSVSIVVTALNLIMATVASGTDSSTGTTLVYLPGVDQLNSKDFNVYEIGMTLDAFWLELFI